MVVLMAMMMCFMGVLARRTIWSRQVMIRVSCKSTWRDSTISPWTHRLVIPITCFQYACCGAWIEYLDRTDDQAKLHLQCSSHSDSVHQIAPTYTTGLWQKGPMAGPLDRPFYAHPHHLPQLRVKMIACDSFFSSQPDDCVASCLLFVPLGQREGSVWLIGY